MTGQGPIGDARGEKQLASMKYKTVLVISRGSGVARAVALAVSEDGGQVRLMMAYRSVSAVRADAVFASGLQRWDEPGTGQTGPGADTAWWPAIRPRMIAEHTPSSASGP
jgi:NAD(P)-dependent dehydrogenase (short-subunit alcohol dehydrogenase family)